MSPDGQVWRVSRRWVPWRRRVRNVTDGLPHLPDGGIGDDPVSAIMALLLLVVMLPFLLLMLVAGLELLLLLAVMPFAIVGRAVFTRRWTIEVRRGWTLHREERAGDWHHSGLRLYEIAQEIQQSH